MLLKLCERAGNRIGDDECWEVLGKVLASSSTLTKVELRNCGIGHQGWLQLKRIVALGLLWKRTCKPSFAEQRRTQGRELRNPALAKALTKKTRFTAEEWEGFSVMETSGLKWMSTGGTQPTNGQNLAHAELEEALARKTGRREDSMGRIVVEDGLIRMGVGKVCLFTQQEWDAFDIKSLRMETYIKSGGSYFKPAVRDLHDGDFIKSDDHHYYKPSVVGVASGLKWLKADNLQRPMVGWSLKNSKLEERLKDGKMEFTQEEWDEFGIKVLRMEDFITLGDSYLKPAVVSQTALLDLSGNRFSPALHEEE